MPERAPQPTTLRLWTTRLVWFVVLWGAGLGAVSVLAYVLRLWIAPK